MNVIPYDFEPTTFLDPDGKPSPERAYMVKLYLLFDGSSCHFFAHQHDLLDNYGLCLDCGCSCTAFTKRVLVTRWKHPKIFQEIEDYVSGTNNH